jgi:NTE family protein
MDIAQTLVIPATYLSYKERSEASAALSMLFGNSKAFTPLWIMPGGMAYYYFFNSPYLYDIGSLRRTISKYVDFTKLGFDPEVPKKSIDQKKNESKNDINDDSSNNSSSSSDNDTNAAPRLILTTTDVQTGEPVIFDSSNTDITVNHVIASAGYAVYGLPWTKLNNRYLWDGTFVHNTPLRIATKVSKAKKIIYVTDVFPSKQEKLPNSMPETYHRIRDLLFTDRSIEQAKQLSDMVKNHISIVEQMQEVITSCIHNKPGDTKLKLKFDKIKSEYDSFVHANQGLVIDKLIHIQRHELPGRRFIFEDADFSIETIKELIRQGEQDAEDALER